MKNLTLQESSNRSFQTSKRYIGALLLSMLLLSGLLSKSVNADIVGVDRDPATITVYTDVTWAVITTNTLTLTGFTLAGSNAVTWNSDNLLFYAIARVSTGARRLVTVDPATGVCTDKGLLSDAFSTLTYSSTTGILYGMTGIGGTNPSELYSIDINTAASTFLGGPFTLIEDEGNVIAYNYDDGFMYHWSGFPAASARMGKIDLGTMTETEVIQAPAALHSEITGAVYIGGGVFVVTDIGGSAYTITTAGAVALQQTLLSGSPVRGLGFVDPVLPVELASFVSSISGNDVTLNWSTSTESNNSGFDIERSIVNGEWSKVGNVTGNGTSTIGHSYSFTDNNLASGNYSYRLKQIDFNGNFEYFALSNEVNVGVPNKFDLSQNYPNPFNPSTQINYDLPFDGNVSIKLFDMSGKEVMTLVNEVKSAGYYSVSLNASNLSSGIYFYSLNADNFTATKKMTLIK